MLQIFECDGHNHDAHTQASKCLPYVEVVKYVPYPKFAFRWNALYNVEVLLCEIILMIVRDNPVVTSDFNDMGARTKFCKIVIFRVSDLFAVLKFICKYNTCTF